MPDELIPLDNRIPANNGHSAALPSPQSMGFAELMQAAKFISASGFWKDINTQEKAMALMLLCQSEGLHPMQAVRRYHIGQGGKPSMKAEAMQAEFQARGGVIQFEQWDDKCCRAIFSHPSSPKPVPVEWTFERAVKAGLVAKNSLWNQYPRNMLKARVVSDGIRLVLPGAILGMYTPEEEADMAAVEEPSRPSPANPPQRPLAPAPSRPIPAAAPAPTPPSAPEPAKPAVAATDPVEAAKTARTAFAIAARDLGCDVMSDTDPDMFHMLKCKDLCTKVRVFLGLPTKEKYTTAEDWAQAEAGLETYLRRSEKAANEQATDASFREDDLEDPFADDAEDAETRGG